MSTNFRIGGVTIDLLIGKGNQLNWLRVLPTVQGLHIQSPDNVSPISLTHDSELLLRMPPPKRQLLSFETLSDIPINLRDLNISAVKLILPTTRKDINEERYYGPAVLQEFEQSSTLAYSMQRDQIFTKLTLSVDVNYFAHAVSPDLDFIERPVPCLFDNKPAHFVLLNGQQLHYASFSNPPLVPHRASTANIFMPLAHKEKRCAKPRHILIAGGCAFCMDCPSPAGAASRKTDKESRLIEQRLQSVIDVAKRLGGKQSLSQEFFDSLVENNVCIR